MEPMLLVPEGEPGAGGHRAYEAAAEALRAGEDAIETGRHVADSEHAAFAVLEAAGFDVRTHSRFGYGVGIAYPPTWLEGALDITRESTQRFEAGMSFVLHTAVIERLQVVKDKVVSRSIHRQATIKPLGLGANFTTLGCF